MPSPFAPILSLADIMRRFDRPWFVSGGWAIDLFLGRMTREHGDVEVGIYRTDQARLHEVLDDWTLEKVIPKPPDDGNWVTWRSGEFLDLPDHQARARRSAGELREFEIFLNESTPSHWTSRRHPTLRRDLADVWRTGDLGVPFLAPDIQLLYKAKYRRPKDQHDFDHALPRMIAAEREWLRAALELCHPGHEWTKRLSRARVTPPGSGSAGPS